MDDLQTLMECIEVFLDGKDYKIEKSDTGIHIVHPLKSHAKRVSKALVNMGNFAQSGGYDYYFIIELHGNKVFTSWDAGRKETTFDYHSPSFLDDLEKEVKRWNSFVRMRVGSVI